MKKIIVILIIVISCNSKMFGQEINLPQYVSHMADNPYVISPAYAGIGTGLQVRLNGVSQWIGVKNAPDTQSISIEARIADRFGTGITVFNDSNGFSSQQGAKVSFASHLTLSDFHDSFLSFALSYNFIQFGIDTSENNTNQLVSNKSVTTSNFDVGMLYRYERFALSLNASNLVGKDIESFRANEPETLRRYSVYSSYTYKLNRITELEPSVFIEHFEASRRSRTDMNIKLRQGTDDGYVWGGLSYTFLNDQFFTPNAITPMLGLKKENFYVSYGFGINVNKVQDFNYGTHMITLGFDYERRPSLARCTQKMVIF
ncbi:type IX secretion system membrane protein PorP/SprF [Tenacibaculum maritimum]|uniref:PorP/SprF family type IX secretion system membrane protein n=1 Tax=Tenacibaculum maritimum TaxID=107401 RepID=UPI00387677F8